MGAWQVTKKDLWLLVRDRRTLAILVVLPLVFITIIGLSTGKLLGWQAENQKLKIVLLNQDTGELAAKVVQTVEANDCLTIQRLDDLGEARRRLAADECAGLVR